ncbi:MAG TPA: hypothetical protein QGF02_04360 [Candidatus Babeliales bacterium]|nr:hypothetical protein [Candidatus Babeliales bacterium]
MKKLLLFLSICVLGSSLYAGLSDPGFYSMKSGGTTPSAGSKVVVSDFEGL